MNINVKVKPSVLLSRAEELAGEKAVLQSILEEARSEIRALLHVWRSEASDTFHRKFNRVSGDIEGLLTLVSEYINNLHEAAAVYGAAEGSADATVGGLPTTGVFLD